MALKFISLFGLVTILSLAWACSRNRRRFPWQTVLCGLALQFAFAILILKTAFGAMLFGLAQRSVMKLNDFAMKGASPSPPTLSADLPISAVSPFRLAASARWPRRAAVTWRNLG